MSLALHLTLFARTDIGRVRARNEDCFLLGRLDTRQRLTLAASPWQDRLTGAPTLIVCDGMGGVKGGDIASELSASIIWRELLRDETTPDAEVCARRLRRALRIANTEVYAAAKRDRLVGMGSTAAVAMIAGQTLVVGNVGDSRVYVRRGADLVQVTRDQSLAGVLYAAGKPVEAQLAGGSILQAIGGIDDIEPSLSLVALAHDDELLLCSDGLSGLVGHDELMRLMTADQPLDIKAELLIAAAHGAGGTDNITVVLAKVADGGLPALPTRPSFAEFDPHEQGPGALAETSLVAHRLAARIGIEAAEADDFSLPTTGQHPAYPTSGIRPMPKRLRAALGPARKQLSRELRMPWWGWTAIVAAAIASAYLAWVWMA